MITVEQLTKRRGARAVVSDVTFRCEPRTSGQARILGGRYRDLPTPPSGSCSTRRRSGQAMRGSRDRCENSVINLELATAAGSSRFFSLALRAGAAMTQDDFAAAELPQRPCRTCGSLRAAR